MREETRETRININGRRKVENRLIQTRNNMFYLSTRVDILKTVIVFVGHIVTVRFACANTLANSRKNSCIERYAVFNITHRSVSR